MSPSAPYTNAMRIGQGFNTYTQEIRLENAVTVGSLKPKKKPSSDLALPSNAALPLSPPITPDAYSHSAKFLLWRSMESNVGESAVTVAALGSGGDASRHELKMTHAPNNETNPPRFFLPILRT
ncbi:hypothetical protein P171DRAFT_480361 [Karstenula rhodostoma CBS 690.94]|uniref:Uncharacterized protein n=1 Tax=Karstenula rhodostoma CBS 690.94 TaxID=1392251 RepID=A0A9P4PS52_9PLEO|nr:hypothetical protein P171DRAFT_480361 [Karstenula rhodostoma CBS 690.94]